MSRSPSRFLQKTTATNPPTAPTKKNTTTREKKHKAHIEETSPSELCKKVRSVEDFQLISSGTYIHINHPHPHKVKLETAGKAKIGGLFKPHLPIYFLATYRGYVALYFKVVGDLVDVSPFPRVYFLVPC